jgi:hypothetical protein
LKKLLPENTELLRGGRFNPGNLTFHGNITCDSFVEIEFGLRRGSFCVKSSRYVKEN